MELQKIIKQLKSILADNKLNLSESDREVIESAILKLQQKLCKEQLLEIVKSLVGLLGAVSKFF